MKQLEINQLQGINGGIACSQLDSVLQYLLINNPSQFQAVVNTFAIFGHGGTYELQCAD